MSAHLDGGQAAIILILAMMGAATDSALDALVRGIVHGLLLLREKYWRDAGSSVPMGATFYAQKKRSHRLLF